VRRVPTARETRQGPTGNALGVAGGRARRHGQRTQHVVEGSKGERSYMLHEEQANQGNLLAPGSSRRTRLSSSAESRPLLLFFVLMRSFDAKLCAARSSSGRTPR
jgi:hypothetical protein